MVQCRETHFWKIHWEVGKKTANQCETDMKADQSTVAWPVTGQSFNLSCHVGVLWTHVVTCLDKHVLKEDGEKRQRWWSKKEEKEAQMVGWKLWIKQEVRMLHDEPCSLANEAFCESRWRYIEGEFVFCLIFLLFVFENMSSRKPCNSTCSVNQSNSGYFSLRSGP